MRISLISIAAALIALQTTFVLAADSSAQGTQRGAKIYGDAKRGDIIVEKWCSSCHARGPVVSDRVPSLTSLAANAARTDGVIRAFLMNPHKPMPPVALTNQEIEDVIAFVHTLAPAKP